MSGDVTRDIFFQNHPDPMLIYEIATRRILEVNNTFKVRYGYSGADLETLRLDDLHPEEELARLERNVAAVTEGLDEAGVWQHRLKSGEVIFVDINSHTLTYQGRACELVVARDVTAAVKAEREREAALKREAKLRNRAEAAAYHFQSLFEAAPGKFLVLTPDTYEIVAISDQYLQATMRKRSQIAGKSLFEIFPDDPDDPSADGVKVITAALERLKETGLPEMLPLVRYAVERPADEGGGYVDRWWMTLFTPVKSRDGSVSYIICRSEDVTEFAEQTDGKASLRAGPDESGLPDTGLMVHARELREAILRLNEREASIRTAERLLALGQWRFDLQTQKLEWSENTFRMYGLDPDEHEPDYALYISLVHPEDRPKMERQYADFIASEARSYEFWHRIVRPDGRVITVRGVAERAVTPEGEVTTGFVQDITGQLETDARLSEAHAQLHFASRAAQIGYWRYDLDAQLVHWSEETAAIHDLPGPRDVTLDEAVTFYMPDDIPLVEACVNRCLEEGQPYDEVFRIRTATGRVVHTRSIGEPQRDGEGNIIAIHGAFQDISELIAARQRGEELAERLQRTLNTMSDAFYTLDQDLCFTFVNREAERILRTPKEDMLGRNVWEVFPEAASSELFEAYETAMRTGESGKLVFWFGPLQAWFRVYIHPSGDGLAVYFQDVTKERASQQQLSLLEAAVARANDVVIIADSAVTENGPGIVYVNDAFEREFGYTREEVIGQSTKILRGPDTSQDTLSQVFAAFREVRPLRTEILHYTKAGEPRWMDVDMVPILNAQGQHTHWLGIQRDITERKAAEQALRIARDEAEEANRLKSEFLANMSHEIRTPLNGVLGMSQLLARTQLDDRQKKMIATVQSSGRALLSIINDILDISKIEAGLMTLDPEPAPLAGICDQAMAAVTATAQEKGLELSVSIAPDLPEIVEVDHRRLGQVLINLLGNAVKFTDAGSVRLVVSALDAAHMRFEVIDTGPGITRAQRSIIFDRFRQLDASFSRAHEGAGLGLALSREFAELMGGEISVESEPGKGASFRLDLPILSRPPSLAPRSDSSLPKRWQAPRAAKILVAEDNATNRETLVMFLQELGLSQPVCVTNGQAALEAARTQDFSLVIMDISMPVLSGLDAIAAIRSGKDCRARVPILALTAHASSEDREQCLKAGANEYLAKPVDLDALAGALSRLLNVKAGG